MRLFFFAALAGVLCPSVVAGVAPQTAPAVAPLVAKTSPSFDQEPVLLRDSHLILQYNADGTGTRTESQVFTLQTDAAVRRFGVVSLLYASATQTAEFVFVRVRHADGTAINTPLDGVQDQPAPVTQEAPFYSDLKIKQLPVRGLRLGDTIEWQTRTDITHPDAANQFWFNLPFVRDVVTLNQTIELRIPTSTHATVWTNPANHVTPQRTIAGANTVYTWQWSSLKPTVGKEAEAAKKAAEGKLLTPDEEIDQTQGRFSDIAVTTFPDWAAVGAWYRSLSADRVKPDATVRAKVAEITAHSTTQQQKIQAVYDWVSANIRYIGVAFGIGRFQPHAAATVMENQYGDCKDKHTLLASMLLVLGEQPDAVLIGSGVRFNQAVPSPAAFNHLITHLTVDGKPVWLDSTAEVAGYQVLNPVLRDKQALVIPPSAPANVERTPAADPFPPTQAMQVVGSLDKDLNSDSEITLTLHDDSELVVRAVLHQVSPAQYTELAQRMMQGMSFGGTVTDASFGNTGDLEKPLEIRFHYHRDRSPEWGLNRITLAFSPTEVPTVDSKSPPTRSIELGQPRTSTSTVNMRLPAGWTAELPEAIHARLPQVSIDTVYHLDGDHLRADRTVRILAEKIPAADWKIYQKWYDDANAGDVPYIQLRRQSASTASSAKSPQGSRAPDADATSEKPLNTQAEKLAEAGRLVDLASQLISQSDYDAAEPKLKAAEALNPNQLNLWGDYGAIQLHRGNDETALKLYAKESELHPEAEFAWRNMIRIRELRKELEAAATVAQGWVAAMPETPQAHTALIAILLQTKKNAEALTAAHAALTRVPVAVQDDTLRYQVAQAEIAGGEQSQAVAQLVSLLAPEHAAGLRNDAAYRLAQLHEQLPQAEATQRDLLQAVTEKTKTWTGDESTPTLIGTSSLLVAGWDTLGYILHVEGKEEEAESYIRAAWLNRQSPEIGEHLVDVLRAEHKNDEADQVHSLLATRSPVEGSHTSQTDAQQKLSMRLQKLRQYPVHAADLPSGHLQLRLMLTRSGVQRVAGVDAAVSAPQESAARSIAVQQLVPKESQATLVRDFYLNCATAGKCEMLLKP